MAKKKLTKLEQMGIIALIIVAASFFYVRRVYEPERERFKSLREKQVELNEEVVHLRWELGRGREDATFLIREKREELREVKSELKEAGLVLATPEDLPEILAEISHLVGRYNLIMRRFSPAEPPFDKGVPGEIVPGRGRSFFNLLLTGSFLDFGDFLRGIGYLPKLVTVEKVVIEREGEDLRIDLLISI